MVYCQECGSEITNIDTFCPFCGISLQTQNIADGTNKDTSKSQDDFADSEVEMTSDDLKNESAEEIDMSETIVVDQSALNEESDKETESGYLDIKSLKADVEETTEDDAIDSAEDLPEEIVEPQSSGLELGSVEKSEEENVDDSLDLDVSNNQEDIEELLTDDVADNLEISAPDSQELESSTDDDSVINTPISDQKDEQTLADEKAIEVVAVTLAEEEDNNSDKSESDLDEEPIAKSDEIVDVTASNIIVDDKSESEFIDSTELKDDAGDNISAEASEQKEDSKIATTVEESQIHSTPAEIQTAEDSEIDEAVSVIDSKALAWKENDEVLTTDTLKDESEKAEDKIESVTAVQETEPVIENEIVKEVDIEISEKEPAMESSPIDDKEGESEAIDSVSEVDDVTKPEILENDKDSEKVDTESTDAESVSGDSLDLHNTNSGEIVSGLPVVNESESSQNTEEKNVEVSSQTTPNIGVGDTDGSKSKKLKPLDEGVVLNDRYEIVRKIGGGGMGAVYLANDKNLGGVLRAVKEMVQSYIEEEQQEKAIQDFKRESMILTSLDHPSIPTIYDYFYDQREARFYLVMKYISGGDLAARLRAAPEGKLDEVSVTDWALQIADVLDFLHSKNPPIVYRDLKPANIMIDGNSDKVMLIDFGIARSINKEEKGVTAVGTMGYAPPELFSGNVEPSSDIYSLGSTMFHLLTGADPQNNPLLIFDFQKHPRPRQINPQLSDQMERILMRSVEYNADRRFSSAAELRNSLKEHLENLKKGNVSFGIKETPTAVALSDQPVFCGFCGQKIVATDMFCAFCGAKQPLAQPGVHSQEYHVPQTTAKLVIEGTSELDYTPFELVKNENLLGRRDPMSNIFPEVDLSKYDPQTKISRKHARIWRDGDNFLLEDLGSSNGTTFISALNDKVKLMPKQTQVLQNGDKIQVGDTTLQFMVE